MSSLKDQREHTDMKNVFIFTILRHIMPCNKLTIDTFSKLKNHYEM